MVDIVIGVIVRTISDGGLGSVGECFGVGVTISSSLGGSEMGVMISTGDVKFLIRPRKSIKMFVLFCDTAVPCQN